MRPHDLYSILILKSHMNRKRRDRPATHGRSNDGMFITKKSEEGNFRTCNILGAEIRVWGADGIRGLSPVVTAALRTIIKRVRPTLSVALMADYHPAKLGVVGSVIASGEHLVPDVIGSDCGCGVYAMCTGLSVEQLTASQRKDLYKEIRSCVPVGAAQNAKVQAHLQELPLWEQLQTTPFVSSHDVRKLCHQLGSLGGGNHFIEFALDTENTIWLLVHSGSRYLGGLLKEHYQGKAIELGGAEASQFFAAQSTVLEYARMSRKEMADRALKCLSRICNVDNVRGQQEIDLVHNFIELRSDSGPTLAVHRKGACSAEEGQPGVIPGSMGTGSYIVEGRGSPASYCSSSHGAGRILSRGDAFRCLSARELTKDMNGIVWSGSEKLKDEAPRAYKDLEAVIRAQRDLVRVRHRLMPILSIKGEV